MYLIKTNKQCSLEQAISQKISKCTLKFQYEVTKSYGNANELHSEEVKSAGRKTPVPGCDLIVSLQVFIYSVFNECRLGVQDSIKSAINKIGMYKGKETA